MHLQNMARYNMHLQNIANEQPTHSDSIPGPYATNEEQHVQADVHEQRALVETSPKVTDNFNSTLP